MSHLIGILLALVSIAVTTCKALPDFHKQMSPQQLQSIFHVDTPDAVPHYEVVQLLHHDSQEPASQDQRYNNYRRRRRSVEPLAEVKDNMDYVEMNHVKKDLSKNPYYSELKSKSVKALHSNSVYEPVIKDVKDMKEHKVSFNAFGKDLNLTLKQTAGLFKNGHLHRLPMWYVDNEANATHGLNIQKIEDELNHTSENVGQVFQDEENMAAILMRRHEVTGDLVMEGSIGHDMVIKPLPHDLTPDQKKSSHHVIFKREADLSEHLSDFAFMEPDDLATSEKLEKLQNRQKRSAHRTTLEDIEMEEELLEEEDGVAANEYATHTRAKRQAPYIIYPEILVIVDYDGYRLHGGDNLQVKRYFISFWNGVDLRYRLLKGPRIRISIAGIIISRGRDATPYLERNRVGRDAIDSAAALTDMGKYLFRERRLPVYDIAVAITKYDMCRRRKGGRCTKGTAGFAYVGGACVVNKRLEKVNSVAIIEDTGGFSGIIVAAHEVGHLLGAVHDGSPPPSYLGGPGAQRCRWEDGYIMSDLRHTERGFRWSPCTVQSFHHFLNGDTATCLHNAPHEDSALGRSLPGTLLSLDAQCRRDRGTYACFKDERVCAQLFCFDAQTGYCVAYRPAAEGSSCGNGLHCLDGRCTPLPSNVIPNYGHQYRLGYKSNEAIGDNIGRKSKALSNNSNSKDDNDDEDDDNDDEEEEDDDNEDEEDDSNDEEEEQAEDDDNDDEIKKEVDNNYSDTSSAYHNSDKDNDNDEQYLTQTLNELNKNSRNQVNKNHIDLRLDNKVDETMLKIKDDTNPKTNYTLNTLLNNFNTYQYLAQLWQNFQTTTTTTTTPPTTTIQPLMSYENVKLSPEQIQLHSKGQGLGYVVVRTSTKSSVSSSSESLRNMNKTTTTPLQHETPLQRHNTNTYNTTATTTALSSSTTSTLLTNLRKQFQYYLKLLQDNSNSNNNNSNNKDKNSNKNNDRKRNNSRNNNRYLIHNKANYNSQTILPSKPYSNSLHNAASSAASLNNEDNLQHNDNDNDDDDDDGNEEPGDTNDNGGSNGGDDNDESNETIEKLKRKLSIPLTTKTLQLQQQQQQPQLLTTAMPITSTYLATNTPHYGSKTTPTSTSSSSSSATSRSSLSTPTFFDNYYKKLQNPNSRLSLGSGFSTPTENSRTNENKSKLNRNHDGKQQQQQNQKQNREQQTDDEKSVTTFEAQFLKRTPENPSTNEEDYNDGHNDEDNSSYSSNINSNNPYYKNFHTKTTTTNTATTTTTTTSALRTANRSSNSNKLNNDSVLLVTTPQQQQQQQYVTNYIGDNTQQRLTTIKHLQDTSTTTTLQQHQQQPQHNSHQHPSTTPPPSLYLFSSTTTTTRRPKIKTQKLIRRLRTQIK